MRRLGIEVELVPETFNAEGLLAAFARQDLRGKDVLIPKAQEGREVLEKGLQAQGARVTAVAVYKTQAPKADSAPEKIAGLHVDLVTFTSPSTFTNFLSLVGSERVKAWQRDGCVLAAIGQVTAAAMAKQNFTADILPEQSTVDSLVEAISRYFSCPEHCKTTS
ncbi:MAG: uroporphyrinogen-III synthase [Calditrichaeota bacterium]|nr:MAG: uroporphyrinogen-III synthase [Calditrichota bacterium]